MRRRERSRSQRRTNLADGRRKPVQYVIADIDVFGYTNSTSELDGGTYSIVNAPPAVGTQCQISAADHRNGTAVFSTWFDSSWLYKLPDESVTPLPLGDNELFDPHWQMIRLPGVTLDPNDAVRLVVLPLLAAVTDWIRLQLMVVSPCVIC